MKSKLLLFLIAAAVVVTSLGALSACASDNTWEISIPDISVEDGKEQDKIKLVYDSYVLFAEESGITALSYEEWLASIKGEDGVTPTIEIVGGYWVINGKMTVYKAIGEKGEKGDKGNDGKSAYELAVENGFDGTLEEWLLSLVGENGKDGLSAFEIYKKYHPEYTGTESEWIEAYVSGGAVSDEEEMDGLDYYPLPDGTYAVSAGKAIYLENIVIPATHNGKAVSTIKDWAFLGSDIITITIPDSVTCIKDYAFEGCKNLTSVTIPNSVTSIGDYAFGGCASLTSVTIGNGVTSIGDYAFENCGNLKTIEIKNGNADVPVTAFSSCEALETIIYGNKVLNRAYIDYIKGFMVPSYSDVSVGDTVFVQSVSSVTNLTGNVVIATVRVIGPKGEIAVNNQTFVAADAGNYSVIYEINGIQKVATFKACFPKGIGALTVTPSNDTCFTVSDNTVTVLRAVEKTEWQSIGWFSVSGWSMANGAKISITINNISVQGLQLIYKFADINGQAAYDDIAWDANTIAVGSSKTWTNNIGAFDIATPTGVRSIELFVASTSAGQFSISASLSGDTSGGSSMGGNGGSSSGSTDGSGNSGVHVEPILGRMIIIDGSQDYFSKYGNEITVKRTVKIDDFKSVGWELKGWTPAKGGYFELTVKNDTTAPIEIIYKVVTDQGEAYRYLAVEDYALPAGETQSWSVNIGASVEEPTSVSKIELFIGAAATGTINVDASLAETSSDGSSTGGNGSSSGGDNGITVGSGVLAYPDYEEHTKLVSVSDNTITIKQPTTGKYVLVLFPVSGWTALKGGNLSLKVESSISAEVEIACMVYTNGTNDIGQGVGVGWFTSDSGSLKVSANETKTFGPVPAVTYDQPDATNIIKLGVMVITSGTGTVKITPIFN